MRGTRAKACDIRVAYQSEGYGMGMVTRVLGQAPVTTVFVASGLGFIAASLVPSEPWALVTFFMLGVPYYLIALLATAIAIDLDLGGHALWVALTLVLLTDALLMAARRAAGRILGASGS